jgi:hypothetical protein
MELSLYSPICFHGIKRDNFIFTFTAAHLGLGLPYSHLEISFIKVISEKTEKATKPRQNQDSS